MPFFTPPPTQKVVSIPSPRSGAPRSPLSKESLPPSLSLLTQRWLGGIAWLGLGLSFVLPPDRGLGLPCCFFRWLSQSPCPGCGLTRSMIAISHGQWMEAWSYHPLVVFVYPLFCFLAIFAVVPASWRQRVTLHLHRYSSIYSRILWWGLGLFVLVGIVRGICFWLFPEAFRHL